MEHALTDKPKRGRGRPPIAEAPGQRFMIHLPEKIADDLRAAGSGSLSRGIIRQAQRQETQARGKLRNGPKP